MHTLMLTCIIVHAFTPLHSQHLYTPAPIPSELHTFSHSHPLTHRAVMSTQASLPAMSPHLPSPITHSLSHSCPSSNTLPLFPKYTPSDSHTPSHPHKYSHIHPHVPSYITFLRSHTLLLACIHTFTHISIYTHLCIPLFTHTLTHYILSSCMCTQPSQAHTHSHTRPHTHFYTHTHILCLLP